MRHQTRIYRIVLPPVYCSMAVTRLEHWKYPTINPTRGDNQNPIQTNGRRRQLYREKRINAAGPCMKSTTTMVNVSVTSILTLILTLILIQLGCLDISPRAAAPQASADTHRH
jgi:hypothetical protein